MPGKLAQMYMLAIWLLIFRLVLPSRTADFRELQKYIIRLYMHVCLQFFPALSDTKMVIFHLGTQIPPVLLGLDLHISLGLKI